MGHLKNADDWVSVCIDGYIAGAHSRDEEIADLKLQIKGLSETLKLYVNNKIA